ncbi:TerB family tellurite resistance protein [Cellulophaga sp. HaHaR_3_176]|jgi:hypothetical protein|uniref:TerB family tellurite resistance protein n=2 Tax=Cellulophaga TaxID=104264 RepID=UPI00046701E7|nr:TerB family tellurite resistance protein [Cellulophaga baltica]QWX84966.1 TerB family tellurite resistance protein [Cellulophaga sp. HaHaR_3_176]QXP50528.1 TerB family tellurite resistance protein [Cellulophaga sp. HaHa_2_1]
MEKINISAELKSHFLRLYQMAFVDDNFDVLELQMLYQFADDRGIPSKELDKLLLNPVNNQSVIPEDLDTKIEYLFDLSQMIIADGVITEDEKNALKKYCKKFGFLEENIEELTEYLLNFVQEGRSREELINELNSIES